MSSPRQLYDYLVRIGIRQDIARAFMEVDRAQFVPSDEKIWKIYSDEVVVTYWRNGVYSTSSQPSLMAEFMQEAEIRKGSKVLEIGGGTGYNAAVMSRVVGRKGMVVSLEYEQGIYEKGKQILEGVGFENLIYINRDGYEGALEYAPYDAIIVTVAVDFVPRSWLEQLADGGKIVVPLALKSVPFYQLTFVFKRVGTWFEGGERFITSFIKAGGVLGGLNERISAEFEKNTCEWQGELLMDRSGMWAVEVLSASVGKKGGFFIFADGEGKAIYKFSKWELCGNCERLERIVMELEKQRFPSMENAKVAFNINREAFRINREGYM